MVSLPTHRDGLENRVVFGEVVGVHIDASVLVEGRLDLALVRPIARCGYQDYALVETVFALPRP